MRTLIFLISVLFLTILDANCQKKVAGISFAAVNMTIPSLRSFTIYEVDTLFSFSTPGTIPSGICWDGSSFWHCDSSRYIYKLSITGLKLDSILNPVLVSNLRAGAMTFDGTNIWLVNEESAKLYQIDKSGTVLKDFYLPSKNNDDPNGYGIAWDGINLWHSQYYPNVIYKINPANGNVIDTIFPNGRIMGIEWINNKFYGMSTSQDVNYSQLVEIDIETGEFKDTLNWIIPFPLDICWDGNYLWNVSGAKEFFDIQVGGNRRIYKVQTNLFPTSVGNKDILRSGKFKLYPNPFNNLITIENDFSGNDFGELKIISSTGKIVYRIILNSSIETIDLSFLDSGLYLLRYSESTLKLIKM